MKLSDYRFTGEKRLVLAEEATGASGKIKDMKDELVQRTGENLEAMALFQEKFYASGREGLILALQAMDAAGKDSTIKHVMTALNPQGVNVFSFKAPSKEELSHDYLWRIGKALPARGMISIFNRSHYEDVLIVDVLKLYRGYAMPDRCLEDDHFIEKRLKQIVQFEEYLYDNGIRIVKFFLHVGREEQRKRFLERLEKPEKNWKFSADDLETRALWDDYMAAYERVINATATEHCPWYVLPADNKWFTRYLVSEAVVDVMEKINPQFPELSEEALRDLPRCREQLLAEKDKD